MRFTNITDVKVLEKGPVPPLVLKAQEMFIANGEDIEEVAVETICIPVLARHQGLLLALPQGALPPEVLDRQEPIPQQAVLGPAKEISVQAAMDGEGGSELPLEFELPCLLADFDAVVLGFLRGFDPVTEGEGILFFSEGDLDVYPGSQALLDRAYAWLDEVQDERVAFYSAEETLVATPRASSSAKAKAKASSSAKRVTTATLSQQLAVLSETIPALSTSLAQLQKRQEQFEATVLSQASAQPPAPHQMEFGAHQSGTKMPGVSPQKFLSSVGSPPRVKMPQRQPALRKMPEDEPDALPEEEELIPENSAQVSQMLVQQAKALNSLVAHLAQDGLPDLGGSSSSSTSISLKGSARRERLLADLAARRGDFFLKTAQNAFRRLKPSDPVPPSIQEFQKKAIFTKYLERQGGYTGFQKDLGLVMWLLAHVADQMIAGDQVGAQEMLALAMVAIEQSAMDGGKWEVAWILSLQEDPPSQIFSHRPQHTNPRLRAFCPLCPADWGAPALAYVKELDLLNTRRSEALPKKASAPGQKQDEENADAPKKPRQPRYPRKPKQQSGAQSQTEGT